METRKRESWGSSIGFILAIAGSAVGLGNVWKFPYITGLNGGGAFVLVYLFCILLVGMPVMLCEIVIGRRTRKNPYGAFKALQLRRSRFADTIGGFLLAAALLLSCSGSFGFAVIAAIAAVMMLTLGFAAVGLFSLITAMLILSYYSVVGGWIVEYTVKAFTGELHFNSVEAAGNAFGSFIHSPGRVVLWHLVFFGASALMVWGGIRNGIERWSKILMPALFLLLVALVFRSLTLPGAENGVAFFLTPDLSKLSTAGALEALGHSFYTLSLGMGITITYGSYLSSDRNIFSASLWVIVLDTGVAILAGLAIFPAVFAMGFDPAAGPSLIFNVLPATFNNFPGGMGWLWAGLFFLMLTIAALTSAAALLESGVTFLIDQFHMNRKAAVLLCFVAIGGLGCLACVSVGDWNSIPDVQRVLSAIFLPENIALCGSWFDLLDKVTSNWMLPIAGMLTAIFVGWIWTARKAGRELRRGAGPEVDENLITSLSGFRGEPLYRTSRNHGLTVMTLWGLLVRFLAPVVIMFVFLQAIGVNLGF